MSTETVRVEVSGSSVTTTPEHPFYVEGKGWLPAGQLRAGDVLRTLDQGAKVVTAVRTGLPGAEVFNLTVDVDHTYYVGAAHQLVHNSCGDVDELADDVVLARGGTNSADRFAGGSGVEVDAAGNLSGVSVNSGRTVEEAAQGIKHNQIGTATVGAVREAGGTVERAPTPYNPGHCLVSGCSAETLSGIFTPTIRNPAR